MDNSESLLTEILLLVQTLNSNVEDFKVKLTALEAQIIQVRDSVSKMVQDGFVDADLKQHKDWHVQERRGWIRRLFSV